MDTKTCSMCNIEKQINFFYQKNSECRDCNRARGLKRYYEKKIKYQINKKFLVKKIETYKLLQKQNNRCIKFRDIVKPFAELGNKLKALEEKLERNHSEVN